MERYKIRVLGCDNDDAGFERGGQLPGFTDVLEVQDLGRIGRGVAEMLQVGDEYNVNAVEARDGLHIVTVTVGGYAVVASAERVPS